MPEPIDNLSRREGEISRRAVLRAGLAGCGLCALSGCGGSGAPPDAAVEAILANPGPVDAGPLTDYSGDGIYHGFMLRGFFIVRGGGRVFAVSSICTHQAVLLNAGASDLGCPRHGSVFSPEGVVLKAPARRALPRHPIRLDPAQRLIVDTSVEIHESQWGTKEAFVPVATG